MTSKLKIFTFSIFCIFAFLLLSLPIATHAQSNTVKNWLTTDDISKLYEPELNVDIPGVVFTDPIIDESQVNREGKNIAVDSQIPWIAQYLHAIFTYSLQIAAVLATLSIIVGGFLYMSSAGSQSRVKKGKEIIFGAITGLVLLMSTYLFLNLINNDLTNFKAITISVVPKLVLDIPEEEEQNVVDGRAPRDITTVSGSNIYTYSTVQATKPIVQSLQKVATSLLEKGYVLGIASGYRPIQKQIALIELNCENKPGSATCNPKENRPQTCILRHGARSCPHTTGRAIDAWGVTDENGDRNQCIMMNDCIADKQACRNNPCQKAVIDLMIANEFCVLDSEPWHFEKPKMSSNCNF
jgi:D-alanyl-D-alanine dipeptidase